MSRTVKNKKAIKGRLTTKLMLYSLLFVFLPLFAGFTILFFRVRSIQTEKIINYVDDFFISKCNSIDEELKDNDDLSLHIITNNEIQKVLSGKDNITNYNIFLQKEIIENILSKVGINNKYIKKIELYTENEQYFYVDRISEFFMGLSKVTTSGYFLDPNFDKQIKDARGRSVFQIDYESQEITFGRLIYSMKTWEYLGILLITYDASLLTKEIDFLIKRDNCSFSAFTEENDVVFIFPSYEYDLSSDLKTSFAVMAGKKNFIAQQMKNRYSFIKKSSFHNWHYIYQIPSSIITHEYSKEKNIVLYLLIFIIIIFCLLALQIYRSIVKPILKLNKYMDSVRLDEFINIPVTREDEIGHLYKSYNEMLTRIEFLINKMYKEQLLYKNAELRALTAQINPHFLYNTLDSINILAELNDMEEISLIVTSLAKLFRASISSTKTLISVKEETEYVYSYITIQKIRFKDRLKFICSVPEQIMVYLIPKMVLQPLVENAIKHGIEKNTDMGIIRIEGRIDAELITLSVFDNGIGLEVNEVNRQKGIGLSNISKRLNLAFNGKSEVKIFPLSEGGTVVELIFPAIKTIIRSKDD